jgi:short subunit dehydrogenase-like uncharacterized protein
MSTPPIPSRAHDIVIYGATGFVGRLTAQQLAIHAPEGVRVALGGRSAERLEALRHELAPAAHDWPIVVADAHDRDALDALAADAHVVASTVGPYAKHGLPLVGACAAAGTHYADLTCEAVFVRDAIDGSHATAVASGARIVASCGFDSVPSDLGVLALAERARADGEGELTDTVLELRSAKGGASGGTIDSVRGLVDAVRSDPELRKLLADPYSLSPDRDAEPDPGDTSDNLLPRRDALLGRWVAPFVMAVHNTRIVRRSNALQGWAYGREFRYDEVLHVGQNPLSPVIAAGISAGLAAGAVGMAFPPSRFALDRLLPEPGEGPSERTQRTGHFRVDIHTRTTSGARYVATVSAKGDPGYAATSVMLSEAALSLALDTERLPAAAGVLTPATGIGTVLTDRLRARGFRISVERA